MTRVALITGGTGFVGSRLVYRLLQEKWIIHVIIRPASTLDQLEGVLPAINLHTHDGSTGQLINIIKVSKPNIVFNLAALGSSDHKPEDVVPLLQSNVVFATQLIEAMVINGVYCLVNTGTFWQHYQGEDYNPVSLYAASKKAFQDILQYYSKATPLKALTLELHDTYGPHDPRKKLFTLLKQAAASGETIVMTPGEQIISLVYIDDVIQAFVIAAEHITHSDFVGQKIYTVSAREFFSLREIVALYEREVASPVSVKWGGRSYRKREMMSPWTKGEPLPEWEPQVDLREGVNRMIAKERGKLI